MLSTPIIVVVIACITKSIGNLGISHKEDNALMLQIQADP
jgi:hypothetical protein